MKTYWKPVALVAAIMALAIIISDSYYQWIRHVFKGSSEVEDTNQNGIPDDQESGVTAVDSTNAVNTNLPASIGEARGIPYTIYEVDPTKGLKTVHTPTGSIIDIPPDAFLNSDGSRAQEKVKIYYREFHSYYDAVISGVPMDYEENGKKYALETSGMLEMLAVSSQGRMNTNPNAPIHVDIKTRNPTSKANIYEMNEGQQSWIEVSESIVIQKVDSSIIRLKPTRPVLFDEIAFNVQDEQGLGNGLGIYHDCFFMPCDGKPHGSSCNKIDVMDLGNGGFMVEFEHRMEGKSIWKDQCLCDLVVPSGFHHSEIDEYIAKYGSAVKSYDAMVRQDKISLRNYEAALDKWRDDINNNYYRPVKVIQFGFINCDKPFPYPTDLDRSFLANFSDLNGKVINTDRVVVMEKNSDVGYGYYNSNILYNSGRTFALIISYVGEDLCYVPASETKRISGFRKSYNLTVRHERVKSEAELKKLLFST